MEGRHLRELGSFFTPPEQKKKTRWKDTYILIPRRITSHHIATEEIERASKPRQQQQHRTQNPRHVQPHEPRPKQTKKQTPADETHLVAHFDDPLLHPPGDHRPSPGDREDVLHGHQERLVQGCGLRYNNTAHAAKHVVLSDKNGGTMYGRALAVGTG